MDCSSAQSSPCPFPEDDDDVVKRRTGPVEVEVEESPSRPGAEGREEEVRRSTRSRRKQALGTAAGAVRALPRESAIKWGASRGV